VTSLVTVDLVSETVHKILLLKAKARYTLAVSTGRGHGPWTRLLCTELNMKSYVADRMARMAVMLSDRGGDFSCLNLSQSYISENIARISYDMFICESENERDM